MKAEQAFEKISDVLLSEWIYDGTLVYQLTLDDFEWLEMAKQALKKQIPKKPFLSYCPACKQRLRFPKLDIDRTGKFKYCFCPSCGQAIDLG